MRSYRTCLLFGFFPILIVGCINPYSWKDLMLEHSLTAVFVAWLVVDGRRRPMSDLAYSGLFLFMALHVLGAHYTYSLVPYDDWARALTGESLSDRFGWDRNHFDRLVHFAFGLLVFPACLEVIERRARVRGLWAYVLTVTVLNSFSTAYELLEWAVAFLMDPAQAELYNGQQGDVWDAHKDIAFATAGVLLAGPSLALWRVSHAPARAPARA